MTGIVTIDQAISTVSVNASMVGMLKVEGALSANDI